MWEQSESSIVMLTHQPIRYMSRLHHFSEWSKKDNKKGLNVVGFLDIVTNSLNKFAHFLLELKERGWPIFPHS